MEARAELQPVLRSSRDVLYLDLALENVVRSAAERGAGGAGAGAAAFVAPLLQNLALSLGDNEEVCYCLKAWQDLPESVRKGQRPNKDDALRVRGRRVAGTGYLVGCTGRSLHERKTPLTACCTAWALSGTPPVNAPPFPILPCATRYPALPPPPQAMAVIERIRRALAGVSDHVSHTLGPISQAYGDAFGCENWAVQVGLRSGLQGGWRRGGGCPLWAGQWCDGCVQRLFAIRLAFGPCTSLPARHQAHLARPVDNLMHVKARPLPPTLPPHKHTHPHQLCTHTHPPQLFPEEVVRGGPAFAVSLVLSAVEPHMRGAAELGAWQVISPANCYGRLEIVPDLHDIQEKVGALCYV